MRKQAVPQTERTRRDATANITSDKVAELAYRLWNERGCPIGSPDEDWFKAEAELTSHWELFSGAEGGRKGNG